LKDSLPFCGYLNPAEEEGYLLVIPF